MSGCFYIHKMYVNVILYEYQFLLDKFVWVCLVTATIKVNVSVSSDLGHCNSNEDRPSEDKSTSARTCLRDVGGILFFNQFINKFSIDFSIQHLCLSLLEITATTIFAGRLVNFYILNCKRNFTVSHFA